MPFIANLYKSAKEKNILAGLIIIDLIAFISYMIFPAGIIYLGDLQMIIGCIIGVRFSLKNTKSDQVYIKHGVIVGLGGAILSAFSMSIFDWIIFSGIYGSSPSFFTVVIGLFLIEALIVGLIIGLIVGGYYSYKNKIPIEKSSNEKEFYESLKR
ncbi:MAG: hypothetical protein KGD65_07740 [Candidatus Lokiarchaeota archaeon]|nr:hypothetical protein [Candidatus Lokiarchaeota archaeon]